jgi:RNA polymerase sigma factor (sigma-70 family)
VLGRGTPNRFAGGRLAALPSIGRASRVEGAPAPEADATRALYEQYANQIFRYCLHQLGSREEAEDAVQTTFLNAFRGIKRGIVPDIESAWLFKIANNVCLSRRRSTWRRGRIESPTDFEVVEELAPAPSRRADELIGLQDVLGQLPETQRRAILLREWQGLSYREIAAELELSQAAVETLIFRARRSLASGLEEPPAPRRRGIARALDLGNVFTGLKSLLVGGSAAAKIAATVAAVSATTVVATAPVVTHHVQSRPAPAGGALHARPEAKRTLEPTRTAVIPAAVAPVAKAGVVKKHRTVVQKTRRLSSRATAHDPVVQETVVERPVTAAVSAAPASTSTTGNGQSRLAWKGKGANGKNGASQRRPVAPAPATAAEHPGRGGAAHAGGGKSHGDGQRPAKGGNLPEPDPVPLQAPAETPQDLQIGDE